MIFGLNVVITSERVTVKRNGALSFGILLFLIPGIALLATSPDHHQLNGTKFAVGSMLTMLGASALFLTPWLTPSPVELTREGPVWGRERIPRAEIISMRAAATKLRTNAYKSHSSWSLAISVLPRRGLLLDFGAHSIHEPPTRLTSLANAMSGLLASPVPENGRVTKVAYVTGLATHPMLRNGRVTVTFDEPLPRLSSNSAHLNRENSAP